MSPSAARLSGQARARHVGAAILAVGLACLVGIVPAGAGSDPPPTDPTTTTDPPPTDPTTTQPPATDPPSTPPPTTVPSVSVPPATTVPTVTQPAPSPAPPSTARTGGGPVTTASRPPTTRTGAPAATEDEVVDPEPAAPDEAETAPSVPGARGTATLPLLVAPTTAPEPTVVVLEPAPVATSKVLPLAIIVTIGLGGLALVLRPRRGSSVAAGAEAAADPVLLAGPALRSPADPATAELAPDDLATGPPGDAAVVADATGDRPSVAPRRS